MRYHSKGHSKGKADKDGCMTNIFDRSHYLGLLEKEVTINGHGLGHNYFSDPRNVALVRNMVFFKLFLCYFARLSMLFYPPTFFSLSFTLPRKTRRVLLIP